MATLGPERSGSAMGVPVPSITTRVRPAGIAWGVVALPPGLLAQPRRQPQKKRKSELASERIEPSPSTADVEPIQVHHFRPRRDEVVHELFTSVGGPIDLGPRAQLRVRAED